MRAERCLIALAPPGATFASVLGFALLGAGMMVGGLLAWLLAATVVLLPYDELFVGMDRAALAALNPRLLPFMAHDRISLAGTMIAIGILYWQLARHGVARGARWAWRAVTLSAAVGFGSFFLFLGHGYFDPLHALVSAALLPFFLLGVWGRPALQPAPPEPSLPHDWRDRVGRWGQGAFILTGIALTVAGATIAILGATVVFVPEDLGFLRTSAAELHATNGRLVPLIAHDRAGFGGALVANGLAVLLAVRGGWRRGARWLWWTLLGAGLPGFVAAIGVHFAVGYVDLWHLAPALSGALLYSVGLALAAPALCAPSLR